jgi:PAS domain S-box-containing protein
VTALGDDVVLVGRNGIERPIEDRAAPIRNGDAEVTGCVIILRDVSERRRAATAIRVSEEQLADFFENANVGIHWIGPDAVIQRVNQAELDMLGYDRSEYLGRPIADFHADADVIAEILDRLKRGEQLRQFPARLVRKDGEIRDCLISSSVYWEGGEFVHTRCITVDVTEHLQSEVDLRVAHEQLAEADRRKDEFLATLAHELRNPLAPVRNSLEILRRSREKPQLVDQALSTMERQMTHLERLVDDLIDISRISRGWIELRKGTVELASIVFSAVETVRSVAEQKGLDLQVDLPPEPVFLEADPVRMTQIVTNLLTNAVKYTPANGRITLSAEAANDRMALSVRDTGLGIPADMLRGCSRCSCRSTETRRDRAGAWASASRW